MLEQHINWFLSQRHKQILPQVLDETEFSFFSAVDFVKRTYILPKIQSV